MTAPGDPLTIGDGAPRYRKALTEYQGAGFVDLENQIEAAMVNQIPAETKLLWEKKMGPRVFRGYIATIESRSDQKKTAVFEVHYVAGNDKRSPTHLTFGSFPEKDKAAITALNGGTRVKGG